MADQHGDDRPVRYVETAADGSELTVYRASAVGGCERAMVAAARGEKRHPTPEKFQAIFDEGHVAEPLILAMWEEAGGAPAHSRQAELELTVMDGVVIRAHVDALYDESDGSTGVYECKKFRTSTWKDWLTKGVEVHANYPWQVSIIMHAWHQMHGEYPTVTMLGGRWEDDTVVELAPQYITNPPIPLRAFKKKIARVERLLDEGYSTTDAEVTCTESYPCQYWHLHPSELAGGKAAAADKPVPVKIRNVPERIKSLLAADVSYKTQLKMIDDDTKKIKARRDANRVEIMAWMAENGVKPGGSAVADGYAIDHVKREVKGYEVKPRVDEYLTVKFEKPEGKTKKAETTDETAQEADA